MHTADSFNDIDQAFETVSRHLEHLQRLAVVERSRRLAAQERVAELEMQVDPLRDGAPLGDRRDGDV